MEEQNPGVTAPETPAPERPEESELVKSVREEYAKKLADIEIKHKKALADKDAIIKDLISNDTRHRAEIETIDEIAARLNKRIKIY